MTSSISSTQLEAHLEVPCFQHVLGMHPTKPNLYPHLTQRQVLFLC